MASRGVFGDDVDEHRTRCQLSRRELQRLRQELHRVRTRDRRCRQPARVEIRVLSRHVALSVATEIFVVIVFACIVFGCIQGHTLETEEVMASELDVGHKGDAIPRASMFPSAPPRTNGTFVGTQVSACCSNTSRKLSSSSPRRNSGWSCSSSFAWQPSWNTEYGNVLQTASVDFLP